MGSLDVAALAAALGKAIGENDAQQEVKIWLDTGLPSFNMALSGRYDGGMPVGRMVEMFGPPSSGKTAIATNVMAAAQRAGGIAVFMDHERSFDVNLARKLGLSDEPGQWVYKTPSTFEESIDLAREIGDVVRTNKLIATDAPIVVVFDSLAAMVPKSKWDKKSADFNMNDNTALARATSASFPALAQFAEKYGILVLFLNQARTKIGVMYGDPTTTPGGNAPEFYASIRIKLGASALTKGEGKEKRRLGQRIGAETIKNKCYRPFIKTEWDFLITEDGRGKFDAIGSTIDYLTSKGLLETSGAWIKWTDGKKYVRSQLVEHIEEGGFKEELFSLLPVETV